MKYTNRPKSKNIQDLTEGSIGLEKRVGKSLTYQNYEKRPRSKSPTNKTGNDSMPRRSEKTKKRNRQR